MGHNHDYSKFLGSQAYLRSTQGNVRARRLRTDDAYLEACLDVNIDSYVEAQKMKIKSGNDITIKKRLGVSKEALI